MTRAASSRYGLFASLAFWLGGSASLALAQGMRPVTIVLLAEAVVDDSQVTLEQIANLTGGTDALRKRLGKLDVADFKLSAARTIVLSEQVRFRLLLAGMEATEFHLGGAKRTLVVERNEPATLRKILAAAEQTLRAQYPGAASQVSIMNYQGVYVPAVDLQPGERLRFEAKMKGPAPQAGRALVEVALMVSGKTREVVPVYFEIAEADVPASAAAKEHSGVRPALYTTPALDSRHALIKARDNVKIIANVGSARLEALGEAQQDGRLGDVIRVRNIESNRIVHGRVEAGGIVLVDY